MIWIKLGLGALVLGWVLGLVVYRHRSKKHRLGDVQEETELDMKKLMDWVDSLDDDMSA